MPSRSITAAAVAASAIALCLAAPASALSLAAAAQAAPTPDAAANVRGADIMVTAVRVPRLITEISSSVTVLDKLEIDRMQDIGVTELLARTPGVSFVRNGGYGTATTLRLRGAEAGQTVVVIDGVKLNDPSNADGSYNFANLLVGDASRIEILRGPQSILWGSQAIGGVVNIVTPLPEAPLEGSVDVEAGARETISARAAIGGHTGPLRWRIAGQNFTTDGISTLAPQFGGTEADGYTNRNVQGRAELELTPAVSVDVRGYYADGRSDFDDVGADAPNYAHVREFVGYVGLNVALADGRLRNRIAYSHTNTRRENFDPRRARPQTFDAQGRNQRIEYEGSFAATEQLIAVFGAEHERASFRSVSPAGSLAVPIPDPARGVANTDSLYAQLNAGPWSGLTLTAGVRYDHHSRYGGKTLFAAGAAWELPTGTVLRLHYGEGFKAPTLYQMFSEYGNTGLAPEIAHGYEAGITQTLLDERITLGATWFDRRTKGEITYVSCFPVAADALCFQPGSGMVRFGYYDNIARSRSRGIEASASVRLGALAVDGNYSWIAADDRSVGSASFGNWLPRRPRHMANGAINYALPFGLDLGAAVRWSGKAWDDAANSILLPAYTLVDLRAEYRIAPQLRIYARAENLFDRHYMTAYRYGTLGRGIHVGFRGRF